MKKISMPNLPEFSNKNYSIAGYIVASLITLSGGGFVYEVLFNSDLTFSANWNMFKSPLGNICMCIGFICAIVFWGKMGHWSRTPVIEYRDSSGRFLGAKEDMDIMEQSFAKILLPFLGHFVLEPIIYGALIYYPIQCIIALVGTIFPYILSLIVLAIMAGSWFFTKKLNFRYHSIVLVLLGVLFTVAFCWGGYALHNAKPGSTISMLADTSQQTNSETITDDAQQTPQDVQNSGNEIDEPVSDSDEEIDDQFEGVGEEGLFGSLPVGITEYSGDMAGFPIEFAITKSEDMGNIKAVYKNVKYGTTMNLSGESLPAMGGDISFYGSDGGNDWTFNLSGDANNITGTAQSGDGKELKVNLHKKETSDDEFD